MIEVTEKIRKDLGLPRYTTQRILEIPVKSEIEFFQ